MIMIIMIYMHSIGVPTGTVESPWQTIVYVQETCKDTRSHTDIAWAYTGVPLQVPERLLPWAPQSPAWLFV